MHTDGGVHAHETNRGSRSCRTRSRVPLCQPHICVIVPAGSARPTQRSSVRHALIVQVPSSRTVPRSDSPRRSRSYDTYVSQIYLFFARGTLAGRKFGQLYRQIKPCQIKAKRVRRLCSSGLDLTPRSNKRTIVLRGTHSWADKVIAKVIACPTTHFAENLSTRY